jgi:hypothetical protein
VREEEGIAATVQEVSKKTVVAEESIVPPQTMTTVTVPAPESPKAPEQTSAAPAAPTEPAVKKTLKEPVAAKQELPVKPVATSSNTQQKGSSAKTQKSSVTTEATPHPASLGRIGNDPRDNPNKQRQSTVLQPGVAKSAAPSPSTTARAVAQTHPSLVGRIANDPRRARQPDDKDDQVK